MTNQTPAKHIVQVGESLYLIAKKYGLTVAELKQLNPLASSNLRVGQELIVGHLSPQVIAPPDNPIHIVKANETLYSIAREYEITVSQLIKLNGLISNMLKIGQKLKIRELPVENQTNKNPNIHVVARGDSLFSIAQQYGMKPDELMDLNQLKSGALSIGQALKIEPKIIEKLPEESKVIEAEKVIIDTQSTDFQLYTIQSGDSLYNLGRKFNVNINALKEINQLKSDLLKVGQTLKIPTKIKPVENTQNTDNQVIKKIDQNTSQTQTTVNSKEPVYENEVNHLPAQMKAIVEARKIFKLTAQSGLDFLSDGLKGPIGRNHVNRPEDLAKVQQRLVQLKMLSPDHLEAPEEIRKRINGGAITSNLIPLTIEAIERFQNQFKVRFWIEHSTRVAMMQTNSFTSGVVVPNDITYRVLRDYTQYQLSFPHPQTEEELSIKFSNFPRSEYTKFYEGISYSGTSNPEIPLNVFSRLGLSNQLASALKYVSRNEGNFDAINTYDDGIFSYGFIQFAGNGGGFAPLLASIKYKAPKLFEDFFQKYGIDVEYSVFDDTVRTAKMIVINPYDKGGKYFAEGLEAERVLRADKQLYGVFIRAGHHLPIITLQIDNAIKSYVRPALNIKLNIIAGTLNLTNVTITDLINSPMGLAFLIDLTINRWTSQTRDIFRDAIEKVFILNKFQTEKDLKRLDEKQIIEQILSDAKIRRDDLLLQRGKKILESDLSFEKV